MNDLAIALLSAEVKQLVALGAIGIVLVVALIAAAMYHNTRTFGKTQQQSFQFQGQLLQLYSANNTILSQQGDLLARNSALLGEQQRMAQKQIEVQQLLMERIEQQSARIDDDYAMTQELARAQQQMLPELVHQFAEQIKSQIIPAITDGFNAQQQRNQQAVETISERLLALNEKLSQLAQSVAAAGELSERHHHAILDVCGKLLELATQTGEEPDERGTDGIGDGGDHGDAGGGERGAAVFEPTTG